MTGGLKKVTGDRSTLRLRHMLAAFSPLVVEIIDGEYVLKVGRVADAVILVEMRELILCRVDSAPSQLCEAALVRRLELIPIGKRDANHVLKAERCELERSATPATNARKLVELVRHDAAVPVGTHEVGLEQDLAPLREPLCRIENVSNRESV